jgi:hypothetical protein
VNKTANRTHQESWKGILTRLLIEAVVMFWFASNHVVLALGRRKRTEQKSTQLGLKPTRA